MLHRSKGQAKGMPSASSADTERPPILKPKTVKVPGVVLGLRDPETELQEKKRVDLRLEAERAAVQEAIRNKDIPFILADIAIFRGEAEDPDKKRNRQPGEAVALSRIARPNWEVDKLISSVYEAAGAAETAKAEAGGRIVPLPSEYAFYLFGVDEASVTANVDYTEMQGRQGKPAWLMQIGFNLQIPVPDSEAVVTPYILLIATEQNPAELPPA